MRGPNFAGVLTDFSAEDIMNRNVPTGVGPKLPGVGLAKWTAAARRAGLFQHLFKGAKLGASILFNLEAQVDYLTDELARRFHPVNDVLRSPGVALDDASDEVAYRFEVPGVVLDAHGHLLPRSDPHVQALFVARRTLSREALQLFGSAPPAGSLA
jgi:hypothetical protein